MTERGCNDFIAEMRLKFPGVQFRNNAGTPEDNRKGWFQRSPEWELETTSLEFIRRIETDKEVEKMRKDYDYQVSLSHGGEGKHGFVADFSGNVCIPRVRKEYLKKWSHGDQKIITLEEPAW